MRQRLRQVKARRRPLSGAGRGGHESGRILVVMLGFTLLCILLITGTLATTMVHVARMQVLDAADGASLAAANAVDETGTYKRGATGVVILNDAKVKRAAREYLARKVRPESLRSWSIAPGTGTSDGETAEVWMTAQAKVPFIHDLIGRGYVTINVRSRSQTVPKATHT